MTLKLYYGVGRRKSSVARAFLKKGTGNITINKLLIDKYFDTEGAVNKVLYPLVVLDRKNLYDIKVLVRGGGRTGQADAVALAIARAVLLYSEDQDDADGASTASGGSVASSFSSVEGDAHYGASVKSKLRSMGCLTVDSRKVERKVCGRPKSRKRKQYSKR